MTWKINRQKKIRLGSPTRWTRYFGFDVRYAARFQQSPAILDGIAFVWLDNLLRALHCARMDIQIR